MYQNKLVTLTKTYESYDNGTKTAIVFCVKAQVISPPKAHPI